MIDNFYYYYYFFFLFFNACYCISNYLSVRILFCIVFHFILVLLASILVGEEPPLWIHY